MADHVSPGESLLTIRDLSVDFATDRGRVQAVRGVNVTVGAGRVVGIVGESGSGKSTVLWSILGLLSRNARVTGGHVRWNGQDLLKRGEAGLRDIRGEEISVVFQDPMTSQIPILSYARQMSDILYRQTHLSRSAKRDLAMAMLARVGIPDPERRIAQFPWQFSGGMRQRAAIGMALLPGPQLLLADEPTTALDVTMEAQIIHNLRTLQDDLGMAILVVSHNLGLVAELCDDVLVMYAGEVVETGPVAAIFHDPQHPYTRALLECDPARIGVGAGRLPVIPGDIPDLIDPPVGCVFAPRCASVLAICHDTAPPDVTSGHGHVTRCHRAGTLPQIPARAAVQNAVRAVPADGKPLLEVADMNVRFAVGGGGVWGRLTGQDSRHVDAVLDASLSILPGQTLGLVGESGSGKTTLGRAILNLVPAHGGTIRFQDTDIRAMPEHRFKALRRDMAMMFQDPVGSLSPRKSVQMLITEPFLIHGLPLPDAAAEAARLADLVRLPHHFLSRYPHELSGGQARRVGVARALALNPKLIIADEPTAGLDVSVQGEILNLMAELQAEHGLAYLIITHNLPVVRHVADRLAIMYLGRIIEEGPTASVFAAPLHPYTHALVNGIPQPDPSRRRAKPVMNGEVPSLLRRPQGCDFAARCPFARPRCAAEKPAHHTASDGRTVACHFPLISL